MLDASWLFVMWDVCSMCQIWQLEEFAMYCLYSVIHSSYYGSTTLYAEFWPFNHPSIIFYPGQGSSSWYFWLLYVFSNTILLAYLWSSIGLLEMGFQEYIALTILVSCILSMWPSHSSLSVLMKFMVLCFIILYLLVFLELLTSLLAYFVIPISVWQVHHHCCNDHQDEIQYCCCSDGRWWRGYLIIALASH